MADSSDEFESDLSCESEYESVESSDEWESESSSEEEEVDSDSEVVEGGKRGVPSGSVSSKSKLKITRSVKTISQPKRERCSLLVMGSWFGRTLGGNDISISDQISLKEFERKYDASICNI